MSGFGPLIGVEVGTLLILTLFLVWWYRSELTPPALVVVIALSWFLGFLGTLLLPIDIAVSSAIGFSPVLLNCWTALYWSTFALAWAVLPILNDAWYAGDFTWRSRFLTAVKVNCTFYFVSAVGAVGFMLYLVVFEKLTVSRILDFSMAVGNSYGLLLVIGLMGNGLVETPRSLWQSRDPSGELQRLRKRAVLVDEDLNEATGELFDAERTVRNVIKSFETHDISGGDTIPSQHLRLLADRILEACDRFKYTDKMHRFHSSRVSDESDNKRKDLTMNELADLHRRVRIAQERCHSANQRKESLVQQANFCLEEAEGRVPFPSGTGISRVKSCFAFYWRTRFSKIFFTIAAILATLLSALVVWSEVTLPIPADLSPFGFVLNSVSSGSSNRPLAIQLVALVPYAYMSICTFSALLKFKAFGLFALQAPHQSLPGPLLFNAMYICRLQFPLGYNYLSMLSPSEMESSDPSNEEMAFTQLMSNMATVPILGQGLNVYAPLFLVVLVMCTLFHFYARILKIFGVDHEDVASEDEAQRLKEGTDLIARWERQSNSRGRETVNPLTSLPMTSGRRRDEAEIEQGGGDPAGVELGGIEKPTKQGAREALREKYRRIREGNNNGSGGGGVYKYTRIDGTY